MSVAQAATRAGVSTRTLKRWIAAHLLPATRLPSPSGKGHLRIRLGDLEALRRRLFSWAGSGISSTGRPGSPASPSRTARPSCATWSAPSTGAVGDRTCGRQEDVAALYKQLSFAGVKLVTLAEGAINELHVGLKGTMNALYIKDLAQKTRRDLEGRVRQGRSGGGLCYGYDVVRELDARGEPVYGGRKINEAEAAVVRRIFEAFANGKSPRALAHELNAEGVTGPGGRPWGDTTIRGHALRRTGLLHNELYIGKLVWNKQHYVKDPVTSKRLARPNPEAAWIVQDVPALRIVDQPLWDKVQARLSNIREAPRVQKALARKFWLDRRPKHLLTGLAHCGECGAPLAAAGKDYLACGAARRQGTCSNRQGIRRGVLEGMILSALADKLMTPELVAEFVREYHAEVNRQRHQAELSLVQKRRDFDDVSRKLTGLIEAIADGLRAAGLQSRLDELERRKATLAAELDAAPSPAPRLHPNLAEVYRKRVADLQTALADPATHTEALEILRALISASTFVPPKMVLPSSSLARLRTW